MSYNHTVIKCHSFFALAKGKQLVHLTTVEDWIRMAYLKAAPQK